jgi:hypothetical protein
MKPVKFVRSRGYHKGAHGIRFKELKPYQAKFLEDNTLIRPHASTDDRYVQILFRILEYEIHYKDHLKLYYNPYTEQISSYDEILEDAKMLNWKCSVCRCDIKSEMSNFEIDNFLCDTCKQSHGKPSDIIDDRILESSIQFRKYCQDILIGQQKSYIKYIKKFESGSK